MLHNYIQAICKAETHTLCMNCTRVLVQELTIELSSVQCVDSVDDLLQERVTERLHFMLKNTGSSYDIILQ